MQLKEKINLILEYVEDAVYLIIGILLIFASIFLIIDVFKSLFHFPGDEESMLRWIVAILDKTLLLMMLIEILYTVRVSFKAHSLCAEPFLIVGLIAGIRRILVISVETAYQPNRFNAHMIEISILGILVFIFVISILFLKKQEIKQSDRELK